uniref:sugar O-acetyltransferase n=1 Tax=Thaumasiovibrio occultus TaxID=1891184 RepID=UPI000B355D7E|nr:sugar O-acetyltransferase [Thaumasiovibrio occultus]
MRTEKQKMLAGEIYQTWDNELKQERDNAKKLCFALNNTCPTEREQRSAILAQLMGVAETDAHIESPFNCDFGYNLKLGKAFYANHNCTILDCAPIVVGDNCLLAPGVVIAAAAHPLEPTSRAAGDEFAKAITIGNNVWLGANVTVCPGVTIGDNVVVAAGAVVASDLPANTLCVGVPAKPIRELVQEEISANIAASS